MSRQAFSLAEVMVGLVFLTIAVFGMVATYIFTLKAEAKGERFQTASRLARTSLSRVEARLAANFDDPGVSHGRTPLAEAPGYDLAVTVTPGSDPDLKRVDLAIYWSDQQGPHDYSVWLVLARP